MYRLMIKTHDITNMKYLCITKREKWEEYTGSGSKWLKHLKKYGCIFSTELLYESEDYEEFLDQCFYFSELFNVALNEEFANVIPEHGYEGTTRKDLTNLEAWWLYASENEKKEIYKRRAKSLSKSHEENPIWNDVYKKISEKTKIWWMNFSLDERREKMQILWDKSKEFFENKETDEYKSYVKKQSENMINRLKNTPSEILSERIRQARLNTNKESKERRKKKIQAIYASGKHDALFERFSKERQTINNPNARIYIWYGKQYTTGQFKELKIDKKIQEYNFKTREDCIKPVFDVKEFVQLECPYCKKLSNPKKQPGSFKRWHFENCKEKI